MAAILVAAAGGGRVELVIEETVLAAGPEGLTPGPQTLTILQEQ